MLEVLNITALNKGSLLAKCDVHIKPWKMTLNEVKIFEKGANRWVGLPSREYTNELGEKKYIELMTFDNDNVKNSFRNQIMGVIDDYLQKNPEMTPPPAIKQDDEVPF